MGVAIIGGGLLWYLNSQSPTSTLPTTTTPASTITNTDGSTTTTNTDGTTTTTATDGTVTTTDADGTVIDTPETTTTTTTTETTEGSDDSSTVDPTDCSKYRKSQHEHGKVWMSSTKEKTWGLPDILKRSPSGVRMKRLHTNKEQYFPNDIVDWELDLQVRNESDTNCDTSLWAGDTCWFAPYGSWSAGGRDGSKLYCTVIWTDWEGNSYTDASGVLTRNTDAPHEGYGKGSWSLLNGKFRIPDNAASATGVWTVSIEYGWETSSQSAKWDGNVFRAVPESCDDTVTTVGRAENFASDFTRSVYAPAMSRQSFMQF